MKTHWFFALLSSALTLMAQSPVQTCTVTNIRGVPVQGTYCGGSALIGSRSCTLPGGLYSCKSGVMGTMNNCTLVQASRHRLFAVAGYGTRRVFQRRRPVLRSRLPRSRAEGTSI